MSKGIKYKPVPKVKFKEIDDQVKIRLYLINNVLTGNLYPNILLNEIAELRERIK